MFTSQRTVLNTQNRNVGLDWLAWLAGSISEQTLLLQEHLAVLRMSQKSLVEFVSHVTFRRIGSSENKKDKSPLQAVTIVLTNIWFVVPKDLFLSLLSKDLIEHSPDVHLRHNFSHY